MTRRCGQPKPHHLLPLLACLLLLLPACTPSTSPSPTNTPARNKTPIPWPTPNPNRPKLAFSPLELPEAVLGQPYEVTIAVDNNETPVGGITLDDGELAPGLTLNYERNDDSTATISGTPTKAGEFAFELVARCLGTSVSGQEGYQTYTLLVKQE